MEFLPGFVLSPSVFVLAWHFHILYPVSVFGSGKKVLLKLLISAICLFKLVGNFKILQSAPYAGISAAIIVTDFQSKKQQSGRERFLLNSWEYFQL